MVDVISCHEPCHAATDRLQSAGGDDVAGAREARRVRSGMGRRDPGAPTASDQSATSERGPPSSTAMLLPTTSTIRPPLQFPSPLLWPAVGASSWVCGRTCQAVAGVGWLVVQGPPDGHDQCPEAEDRLPVIEPPRHRHRAKPYAARRTRGLATYLPGHGGHALVHRRRADRQLRRNPGAADRPRLAGCTRNRGHAAVPPYRDRTVVVVPARRREAPPGPVRRQRARHRRDRRRTRTAAVVVSNRGITTSVPTTLGDRRRAAPERFSQSDVTRFRGGHGEARILARPSGACGIRRCVRTPQLAHGSGVKALRSRGRGKDSRIGAATARVPDKGGDHNDVVVRRRHEWLGLPTCC
jgi:hypothetical protein